MSRGPSNEINYIMSANNASMFSVEPTKSNVQVKGRSVSIV
jgi:hypothetical protein